MSTPPPDPYGAPTSPAPGPYQAPAAEAPPAPVQAPVAPAPYDAAPSPYGAAPTGYGTAPGPVPSPYGAYPPAAPVGTDGFAIAALVTGILGLGVIPLVLGIVGLNRARRTGRGGAGLAIAGIVLGGLSMLAWIAFAVGVAFLSSNQTFRDAFSEGYNNGVQQASALHEGDCVDVPADATALDATSVVGCAGEHGGEVIGVKALTDATYPGEDAAEATAEDFCRGVFPAYVGGSYDDSSLDLTYLYPSSDTWASGDREVVCFVEPTDGTTLTGSIKASGR